MGNFILAKYIFLDSVKLFLWDTWFSQNSFKVKNSQGQII